MKKARYAAAHAAEAAKPPRRPLLRRRRAGSEAKAEPSRPLRFGNGYVADAGRILQRAGETGR